MAQTTEEIITQLDEFQAAEPDLAEITTTSQTGIATLWKYVFAQAQNLLEKLWDRKAVELDAIVAASAPGSSAWMQAKSRLFQYGDSIELIDGVPQYAEIDEDKQIITRVAVVRTGAGAIDIRVAKDDPPVPLSAPELAAFQSYWTDTGDGTNQGVGIAPAGADITCVSLAADKVYIEGIIYYNARKANVIEDDVMTALNNYLAGITSSTVFGGMANGVLRLNELVAAVKAVDGVEDFWVKYLVKRADGDAFGLTSSGTRVAIVGNGTVISLPVSLLTAGYAVEETTAGETWADKLTFTSV